VHAAPLPEATGPEAIAAGSRLVRGSNHRPGASESKDLPGGCSRNMNSGSDEPGLGAASLGLAAVGKLHRLLRDEGPAVTARKLALVFRGAVLERITNPFDREHGTRTGGMVLARRLSARSGNLPHAIRYQAVDPRDFHGAMREVSICPGEFTFIDIGCGKGRALLLARQLGFRRLIGVEFSPALVAAAMRNLGDAAEIVGVDAMRFHFPEEESVVYMYNPFREPVLSVVLKNLARSVASYPRPVYIVYLNPQIQSLDTDRFEPLAKRPLWHVYRCLPEAQNAHNTVGASLRDPAP
jgi:SAM-dependent methyltransferase